MNLNMIRPKIDTEDLVLSITKNSEKLIKQAHTKHEETLKFILTKPWETFLFNPPIQTEGSWMIGLTSPEVCNSVIFLNHKKIKLELYTVTFDDFSYEELNCELEETVNISNNSHEH